MALLRTVDTDIVVIAISVFQILHAKGLQKFYIRFGMGKHRRDIPNHDMCEHLGPCKCLAMPFFHAFTGCDYTSFKRGIGKKTAWKVWESIPDMTETFIEATEISKSFHIDSSLMTRFELFTMDANVRELGNLVALNLELI